MHYPMFSHAPEPVDQPQQTNEERTVALYVESTLEPHESWAALTEYIHLWWPRQLLQSEESHIDLSTELLLEETADGDIIPVARVVQHENEDVLTIAPYQGTRLGRLMGVAEESEESLSIILDALAPETAEGPLSLLEISSGTYAGREDEELGIYEEQEEIAELLMGAYARFIGAELQREEL
ncbi:MAG: GTPase [Rothia sp.]|uniref:GTPase n=1 Tax=Rothia sp. (in: high G+C Gram-positive bacteria) TaxID=1885016 RepID=UPI001CB572C0|nr:GTPase [Rothia sp. (in: high G+C Gram-positive bacteria)]MBF1681291.1 GTPase [Rothia sp. (in: high G+C Gram-positive bacteria)]